MRWPPSTSMYPLSYGSIGGYICAGRRRAILVPAHAARPVDSPERGRGRKHQRLDHHRHGARGLEQRADVDEVELLEDDAVDRDDRVRQPQLLAAVNADQPADVAVADQHQRQAAVEHLRQVPLRRRGRRHRAARTSPSPASGSTAPPACSPSCRSRRRSAARTAAAMRPTSSDSSVERQVRRDHRHVAQRQDVERRDEDRAAAHLDRCTARRRSRWRGCPRRGVRCAVPRPRTRSRTARASSGPRSPKACSSRP